MRRPARPAPPAGVAVPDGVVIRGYRHRATSRPAAGQRGGVRPPPRAGRDGRRRPGRADGRAVVRPRRPAGGDRRAARCSASTGPSCTPRPRARSTSSGSPRRARAAASAGCSPRRAPAPRRARRVREVHLYVESDNAPAIALYSGLASPTRPRHPRDVPARHAAIVPGSAVVFLADRRPKNQGLAQLGAARAGRPRGRRAPPARRAARRPRGSRRAARCA